MDEVSLDGPRIRSRVPGWGPAVAIALTIGGVGGCEIDCEQRYCDFVRAAASGIYAWEYDCCLNPESLACVDRAVRYQALAFSAPSMRMACEERNWERLGEIWEEVRDVVPVLPLRVILSRFCGQDVAYGENVVTPFASGDTVTVDLGLSRVGAAGPPWNGHSFPGRPDGIGGMTSAAPSLQARRRWVIDTDSVVRIASRGGTADFAAVGTLSVIGEAGGSDDVDAWCRTLEPDDLRLLLRGPEGMIRLSLDRSFEGNVMAFTGRDSGMIGVAVRVDLDPAGRLPISIPFGMNAVFLQMPFQMEPGGGIRIGSVEAMDAFELWPVAPAVEGYITDRWTPAPADDEQMICAESARVVADHFLSIHASECDGMN